MKRQSTIARCIVWIVLLVMFSSLIACGQGKNPEKKLLGTWYYVNGNDVATKVFITFGKEGEMKIGIEGNSVSLSQEEWNELLSGLFGDISDLIKKAGISFDLSAVDLSETLSSLLSLEYEVEDNEEIEFEVTALKLISIKHTSQYSFKKNGDLVLNGMVFRKNK